MKVDGLEARRVVLWRHPEQVEHLFHQVGHALNTLLQLPQGIRRLCPAVLQCIRQVVRMYLNGGNRCAQLVRGIGGEAPLPIKGGLQTFK